MAIFDQPLPLMVFRWMHRQLLKTEGDQRRSVCHKFVLPTRAASDKSLQLLEVF